MILFEFVSVHHLLLVLRKVVVGPNQSSAQESLSRASVFMFPVDLPDQAESDLRSEAEAVLASLKAGAAAAAWVQSPAGKASPSQAWFTFTPAAANHFSVLQVVVGESTVRRLLLFEAPDCPLLTLHAPGRPAEVVAVHLGGRWWSVDQVLRTSDPSRRGLLPVRSLVERVLVFLLAQVLTDGEETPFRPHPRTESCRLLWDQGEAVGFYSVKRKGSLCDGWSGSCYLLPVLDSVLVRRRRRRRGFGLLMLQDFCASVGSEEQLGVSAPLSPAMAAVCRRLLEQRPQLRERLCEVEAPGGWSQRRNIWLSIQLRRYSLPGPGSSEGKQAERERDTEKVSLISSVCRKPNLTFGRFRA
ncbi:protein FAM169B [Synchiropus splendidus]|uniref:protein FAM169B n=1 Tax=Synchiropus splendidus TaxID=270530 RepID=UPI00237D4041|nr:protein FAM169B [Synchiropus splendidus]